ncbi:tetratricopeptide repeat protein [Nonomuraea sp. NPDC049141]|uniref:tetratricopeptide repeat protein n=1 Tax=Nonomuraea sp. NPDC049141 TaxID=3155500 RepID=UPI0033C10CD7
MQVTGPAPQARAGLPAGPVGFVGRTDALREVLAFLDPADAGGTGVVVSAVAGMAGVGKTALALVAAHQAMEQGWFGGGVYFVDLRGYTPDPGKRVSAAAAAGDVLRKMGIRDTDLPPTGEERLALYRSVLAEQARQGLPVLVVADNAAVTGQVEPLLPAQPCHRLLITSRHTLTLSAHLVDLTVLPEEEALDLLRTALQPSRPDPRIDAEPHPATTIARLCGRLPLALQITAALLRAEPDRLLADMAAELADARHRLDALDTGDADSHGRPYAVRAAFDLSYRHLVDTQPEQARLFRLLPLDPGPHLSLSAAAALDDAPEPVTRRRLAALSRAHLVTAPVPGQDRWAMHDLVRLYADEHGRTEANSDGRERALDRMLAFYLDTADAADGHLRALPGQSTSERFGGRQDALAWLDAERANLVAAVALADSTHRHHVTLDLSAHLTEYLAWRRHLDDRLAVANVAVRAGNRLGDRRGEAGALNNLGVALCEMRRFTDALITHRKALTILRKLRDRHSEAQVLNNLGSALSGLRRYTEAITAQQKALTILRLLDDPRSEAHVLINLGNALSGVRRYTEAITAQQKALTILRLLDDRHSEAQVLINLGNALAGVRRYTEAITAQQKALTILRLLDDRHGEAKVLNSLGSILGEAGRFEEAVTVLEDALTARREVEDRHGEGITLTNLGNALDELGQFKAAVTAYRDALAVYRELGERHGEGTALNNLGSALSGVGRFDEAITVLTDALAVCRELGEQHGEGMALNNLGNALAEAGRFEEAVTLHRKALTICREADDRHGEGTALTNLGNALGELGRFDEAISAFERATIIFETVRDDRRRKRAQALAEAARRRNAE